ncbi:MAG TPA: CHAT domain-containing protein [Isosphaeraceae bacterium]|jgi:CHAT domain-containing protein|nr:CHAT domain-containing protein [Isosphaeraceae bacterium]
MGAGRAEVLVGPSSAESAVERAGEAGVSKVEADSWPPLDADLVVFGAGPAGHGGAGGPKGVGGMARTFPAAGRRIVWYSQWRVDDGATAEVLERIYRGLAVDLRAAKELPAGRLGMLRADAAPFDRLGEHAHGARVMGRAATG